MRGKRHPLTGATYDANEDGNVRVVAADGTQGVFTPEGVWLNGELRHADPHLCGWVAGPQGPAPVPETVPQPRAGIAVEAREND